MLTCITCSKQQVDDEGDEMGRKDAVKNLTTQVAFTLNFRRHIFIIID